LKGAGKDRTNDPNNKEAEVSISWECFGGAEKVEKSK
jgi:hypothetical protein